MRYGPDEDDIWIADARECLRDYYGLDWSLAKKVAQALFDRGDFRQYAYGFLAAMAHMDGSEESLIKEEMVA
jgi:hypothetical protein